MIRKRSARSKRKQPAPLPTSSLVDSTLRWLRLDDTIRGLRAVRAFGLAAGPRILSRARAERLRGTTLFVRVATSAWTHELSMMRETILQRMRAIPGGEDVESLRFEVGDIDQIEDWSAPVNPPSPPPREKKDTPQPIPAEIYEALAGMPDPELREKMSSLLARSTRKR